jgi:diaminohydroxyphosphoribosylaminopyrimidine deaminase/5-amino-6-(5-phosphoribosylamino)uracil reductase
VLLKLAISADGKAGAAGGKSIAITGEAVREQVHLLRAQSDAIMIGVATALADDPMLTCRLPGMAKYSPVRVVADSMLRMPSESRLVQSARETPVWVVCGTTAPQEAEAALLAHGVEVLRSSESADPLDLKSALAILAAKGITRLMVEGGPTLAAALLAADLVDEAILFRSDKIIGSDGVEALGVKAAAALEAHLAAVESEPIGPDREQFYQRR